MKIWSCGQGALPRHSGAFWESQLNSNTHLGRVTFKCQAQKHNELPLILLFMIFSVGFFKGLFVETFMVCYDLIRCSSNFLRCVNYHRHTSTTEEAKCFSSGQVEGWFKMYLGPLGSNQNIVHGNYARNKRLPAV